MKETKKIRVTKDGLYIPKDEKIIKLEKSKLLIEDMTFTFEPETITIEKDDRKNYTYNLRNDWLVFNGFIITIESDEPIRLVSIEDPVLPEDLEKPKEE
jgi:hypothetical protein